MKRFLSILSLVFLALAAISCYDDTTIQERLDTIEAQVTELTTQVNSVAALITALENNNYIKSVTEVTGGYQIEFTDGKTITIKDGKDGADAPEIGATKDTDGIYYWTLAGEWLLDASGNKIPAGMGQPKLKTEDDQWYISADGKDWALIGPEVACTIQDVVVTDEAVTFTLAGGEKIVIPFVQALDVTFNVADGSAFTETAVIEYTITGGTEANRVVAMCSSAAAIVKATDANTGVITVGPLDLGQYEVAVFVTDGVSRTIFKTLKFAIGQLTVEEDVVSLGFDAAEITIPVSTSVDYVVTTDCEWLTVPEATKANEVREEIVTVKVAANAGMSSRKGYVILTPTDEACAAMTLKVAVAQKGHANKAWSKEVTSYEDYDPTQKVRLAQYGDNILLANTTQIYVLDPATGDVLNTFPVQEGFNAHSVLVDDAGNLLLAADAAYGSTTTLYLVPDPTNPVPEELLSFDTNNYYCVEAGNFRVKGNVKDDAVVTLTVADGGSGAVIFWEIVDGEFTEVTTDWGSRNWDYVVGPYSGWYSHTTCAAPVGTSLADGFFFIGYGGDYNLKYKAAGADWVTSYVTGSSWMENYNCIATAEWKGNKYAAFVMGCHFNYDMADAVLVDVNDPAAAKHLYTHYGDGDADWDWVAGVNNSWTDGGAYSDILLATSEDTMLMVYVDSQYGTIGCVAIN